MNSFTNINNNQEKVKFEIVNGSKFHNQNAKLVPQHCQNSVRYYQISMFNNLDGKRVIRALVLKQANENGVCSASYQVENVKEYELAEDKTITFVNFLKQQEHMNGDKVKFRLMPYVDNTMPYPSGNELSAFTSNLL